MIFDFATNMGTNPNSVSLIGDIAADLGFAAVRPYACIADSNRISKVHPINFFLFDYSPEFEKTKAWIDEIRNCHHLRVRFSPLICFVESPSQEIIIECVNAGFDDILTLPWSARKFKDRLFKQVKHKNIYFETDTYFGPDRSRYTKEHQHSGAVPTPGLGFRRYEFVRDKQYGVQILQDRVIGKAPKRASASVAGV